MSHIRQEFTTSPTVGKFDRTSQVQAKCDVLTFWKIHLAVWLSLGLILVAVSKVVYSLPLFGSQDAVGTEILKHIEMGCQPIPRVIPILGNARDMALDVVGLDRLQAGSGWVGVGVGVVIFPEVREVNRD